MQMTRTVRLYCNTKNILQLNVQFMYLLISLVIIVLHLLTIIEIPTNLLHGCLSIHHHHKNDNSLDLAEVLNYRYTLS